MKKVVFIGIVIIITILTVIFILPYLGEKGSFNDLVLSHFEGHHYNAMYMLRKNGEEIIDEYRTEDSDITQELLSYLSPLNLQQVSNPLFSDYDEERYDMFIFSRNEKYERGKLTIKTYGSNCLYILFTFPDIKGNAKIYKIIDDSIDFEKLGHIFDLIKAEQTE